MVRVINIDTKKKTIHVSNEDKIDWITVKGTHVPIKEGESKGEAVKKFVEKKNPVDKDAWAREQRKYRETQKGIAKDTVDGLKKMVEKTDKQIADFQKAGKQSDVADLTKYRDDLNKRIKELSKIHGLDKDKIKAHKDGLVYYEDYAKQQSAKEEKARKEREKALKDKEEADFQAWQKKEASLKESATDWYAKTFKSDKKMAPKNGVTFGQLYDALKHGESIYTKMGVNDSIVRERVMEEISDRMNVPYDDIYDMWLHGGEKGSPSRIKKQKEDLATYDKLLKTNPNLDPQVKKLVVVARDRAKKELKQ